MKIFLLRHGESVDDVEDAYGGIADYSLTDAGRRTAQELASKLSSSGIEILYSSPYKRAFETAGIVANTIKCDIKTIEDLRERNSYGVLSGVNKAKSKEIFGGVLAKLKGKAGDYYSDELVVGAENVKDFDKRVKNAFEDVLKDASKQKTIGIVTHGNVTRSIYKNILVVKGKIDLDLLAVTVIDYTAGNLIIDRKEGIEIKE